MHRREAVLSFGRVGNVGGLGIARQPELEARPRPGQALQRTPSAGHLGSLSDRRQPQMPGRRDDGPLRLEPDTVVLDLHPHASVAVLQRDAHDRRLGVLPCVGEGLLGGAIQDQPGLRRWSDLEVVLDGPAVGDRGVLQEVLECRPDALLVEDGWAEVEEHAPHASHGRGDDLVGFGDVGELRVLGGEHLEPHLDRRELLHGVIVDVMRDPTPFVFGGANHMMEELPSLLVRLLQIVDDRAELRRPFRHRGFELLVVGALSLFQPSDRLELRFAFGGEPCVVQRERGVGGELPDHRDLPSPHGSAVPTLEGDDAEPVTTHQEQRHHHHVASRGEQARETGIGPGIDLTHQLGGPLRPGMRHQGIQPAGHRLRCDRLGRGEQFEVAFP